MKQNFSKNQEQKLLASNEALVLLKETVQKLRCAALQPDLLSMSPQEIADSLINKITLQDSNSDTEEIS